VTWHMVSFDIVLDLYLLCFLDEHGSIPAIYQAGNFSRWDKW
jgi:hypothetical protein